MSFCRFLFVCNKESKKIQVDTMTENEVSSDKKRVRHANYQSCCLEIIKNFNISGII